MDSLYVYRPRFSLGEDIYPLDGEEGYSKELIEECSAIIDPLSSLSLSKTCLFYPEGTSPNVVELSSLQTFRKQDWVYVAAILDEYATPLSVLLHKRGEAISLIFDLEKKEILVWIRGSLLIQSPDSEREIPLSDFLSFYGMESEAKESVALAAPRPLDLGDAPEKENEEKNDEDESSPIEISRPAFTPTSSSKPRNLGEIRFLEEETESDTPSPVDWSSFQTPFAGSSKKKPTKIGGTFSKPTPKPASSMVPPAPVQKPSFSATSKGKPRNLDHLDFSSASEEEEEEKEYEAPALQNVGFSPNSKLQEKKGHGSFVIRPSYRFECANRYGYLYVRSGDPKEDETNFFAARSALSSLSFVELYPTCIFVPEVLPKNEPIFQRLKKFDLSQWRILACALDPSKRLNRVLIALEEDPEKMAVLNRTAMGTILVGCISARPLWVRGDHGESWSTRELFDAIKVEEEKKIPVYEPQKEETSEETPSEPVPDMPIRRKPKRRLFLSRKFQKAVEDRIDTYHGAYEEPLRKLYETAIFGTQEEWASYLKSHDGASITASSFRFSKFRFDSLPETNTDRVFFLSGSCFLRRGLQPDDLVFVYLTRGAMEHDHQGEVAESLCKDLSDCDTYLLSQVLLPYENKDVDELAYPSFAQYQLLLSSKAHLPHAFVGSAGTGKTILSLQETLDLGREDERILYLTYQKELQAFARRKLDELQAKNVEANTWKSLCKRLNVPGWDQMDDKRDFVIFFATLEEKNHRLYSRLKTAFGETDEDVCLVCYSFYRGVLEGLSREDNPVAGILSLESFLKKTKKEEGFSRVQKEAIYSVAEAYEDHLKMDHRTTDNRLAHWILQHPSPERQFDAVVIDEYQDLSEIQFEAACSLLKPAYPLKLFLYGDDNQAINPTIFDIQDAKRIVKAFFGRGAELSLSQLNDSYRSGPNLIGYINDISAIRKKAIGARGYERDSRVEVAKRQDEEDVFVTLIEEPKSFQTLLKTVSDSNRDCVFLFPSARMRDEYVKRFQKIYPVLVSDSFLSVGEAKGREWDSCVLVDFFSSSKKTFEDMLGEERKGKHSTLHRMLFNRFYVALTRARNRIVVYEEKAEGIIQDKLLSGLRKLSSNSDYLSYFGGSIDPTHWIEEGDSRFKKGQYLDALRAYHRAGEKEEAVGRIKECQRFLDAENDLLGEEETIQLYLSHEAWPLLDNFYFQKGEETKRQLLLVLQSEDEKLSSLADAFKSALPSLFPCERKTYFALLEKRYELTLMKFKGEHGYGK